MKASSGVCQMQGTVRPAVNLAGTLWGPLSAFKGYLRLSKSDLAATLSPARPWNAGRTVSVHP